MSTYSKYDTAIGSWRANNPLWTGINACQIKRNVEKQLSDSSMLCRRIASYRRVACASPAYLERYGEPQHPKELNGYDCLMYTLPGAPKKWRFTVGRQWVDMYLEPRLVSNNSKLLRSALLAGHGIALIPVFIVARDLKDGLLIPILQGFEAPVLNLYSLRPGDRRMSYRLNLLHNFLCAHLGPVS